MKLYAAVDGCLVSHNYRITGLFSHANWIGDRFASAAFAQGSAQTTPATPATPAAKVAPAPAASAEKKVEAPKADAGKPAQKHTKAKGHAHKAEKKEAKADVKTDAQPAVAQAPVQK